jgi:hypothetical protein
MIWRPIFPYEKWFFSTNEVIQYAVDLATPRHADGFIDYLLKSVAACHLKTDGVSCIHDSTDLPISKIPESVRTARDAAIWAGRSNIPDFSHRLLLETTVSFCV